MMKFLSLLFLLPTTAWASFSPSTIVSDPGGVNQATVNSSHELFTIINPDSNVCKETGGVLAAILSQLQTGTVVSGTVAVSNFPATQPVSIAAPVAVTGTFFQATQPVSGNLGRTWSLLHSTDNVSSWTFDGSGNSIGSTSGALNEFITNSSLPVTGTFFQSTQPVSIAAAVTVAQGTAANLNATVVGSGGSALASAANQTTVISNQTNGTQITQVSSFPANTTPATQNITAQDVATTSTAVANSQIFYTGTPTAGSAATFCSLPSSASIEVLVTGTWTGTLESEISQDLGTTYQTRGIKQSGVINISSAFTQNFQGGADIAAISCYRIRSIGAWTGTATVRVTSAVGATSIAVTNAPQLSADRVPVGGSITAACAYTSGVVSSCAAGSTVAINSVGAATVQFGTSGTWVATMTQDISYDPTCGINPNGVIWYNQNTEDTDVNTGGLFSTWTVTQNNDPWVIKTPGTQCVRLRAQAYTSGTVVTQMTAGQGPYVDGITGVYNTALPLPSAGQRQDLQLDFQSKLLVNATLGNTVGKTVVMKTGNISTTAVTANQVILTYTVTTGKTFYMQYFKCTANTEAAALTATEFGTCSLTIGGTTEYTDFLHGAGANNYPIGEQFAESIPIASGTVVQLITTPSAATAFFWYGNFGGYEK